MPQTLCPPPRPSPAPFDQYEVSERVRAEFREMPGLTLTLRQASRLFDVDPLECQRVFAALVDSGVLVTNGKAFARR